MNTIDKLHKAQSVSEILDAFGVNGAVGTLKENANDIADFIKANYYEKPRSADGTPVDIGSEWYGEDGRKWHVMGYRAGRCNITASDTPCSQPKPLRSKWLLKDKPDSWSSIIDDAISLTDTKKKADLIERCKRLAWWSV